MNLPSRTTAPLHVTFTFDFADPFAYLVSKLVPRACREAEAALTLEPVHARRLGAAGGVPPKPWPAVEAAAARLGMEVRVPRRYPFDSARLLETCLFIKDRSGQEAMAAVTDSLWEAIWVLGEDPESRQTAIRAGRSVAVPEPALEKALADSRMPAMLERVTRRAADRGVDAVPAIRLDAGLFVGFEAVLDGVARLGGSLPTGKGGAREGPGDDDDPAVPDWTFSG
ncbi:MAG: DsbA family protein [Acidobacteriota bacterium]|nr:DsbA family protein [Acidobacteriota bacterium]